VLTHNGRTGIGYKIPVANGAMDDAMWPFFYTKHHFRHAFRQSL
jgi:hypothetical protein